MKYWVKNLNLDWIGFSASILCALHCAVLPLLLSLAPLAGLQWLAQPWIEYTVIIFSFFIASVSLVNGYQKYHQKKTALVMVIIGFLFIITGHALHIEEFEASFTVTGALLVAVAHIFNWKQVKTSQISCHDCTVSEKVKEHA